MKPEGPKIPAGPEHKFSAGPVTPQDEDKDSQELETEVKPDAIQSEYFRRILELLEKLDQEMVKESISEIESTIQEMIDKYENTDSFQIREYAQAGYDFAHQFISESKGEEPKTNENPKTPLKEQLEKVMGAIKIITDESQALKELSDQGEEFSLFHSDYYHNFSQQQSKIGLNISMAKDKLQQWYNNFASFREVKDWEVFWHSVRAFVKALKNFQKICKAATVMIAKMRKDLEHKQEIIVSYQNGETFDNFRDGYEQPEEKSEGTV